MRTLVPGSGIDSRCSRMRPFRVLGASGPSPERGGADGPVEVADARPPVHEKRPVLLRVHVGGHRGGAGRELSHHFFDDVRRRDQALDVAVLVHHEGHPFLPGLKRPELDIERRSEGGEIGLPGCRHQGLDAELAPRDRADHPADLDHPFDRVYVASIDRQLGVGVREDRFRQRPLAVIEVEARDLVPRHHHVVHGDRSQIEQTHQHGPVAIRHPKARFAHHRAELFRAQPPPRRRR